jgi:predicted esterase
MSPLSLHKNVQKWWEAAIQHEGYLFERAGLAPHLNRSIIVHVDGRAHQVLGRRHCMQAAALFKKTQPR